VISAGPAELEAALAGALASVPANRLRRAETGTARAGLVLVDAPDVDSIELDNRALADALVEAADLCIFVTTATRYADRVPWDVLGRVRERGLPLIVVVNRLPGDEVDKASVLSDVERQFAGTGHEALAGGGGAIEVVPVVEGQLDPRSDSLSPEPLRPLVERIDALAADADTRRELAARALAGALAGLGPLANAVADDLEHEAIDVDALRRAARSSYGDEEAALIRDLRGGRFLREEVLRQWQSFVGADQVTRFFASGIGRVRGALVALVQGTPPAPVSLVEQETTSDLVAIGTGHLAEAARRTAGRWSETPSGAALVATDPGLWGADPASGDRLASRLRAWTETIATDVRDTGAGKRTLARGASIGVNAAGTMVMLSVFTHTGGLTGAEVGVAAATAFLNQKLLGALFGEAATVEMIDRARRRLAEAFTTTFTEDRERFERLVPDGAGMRTLAAELREAVETLRPETLAP
jgi:hypothetical protein